MIEAYLTRQRDGKYMLTSQPPVIKQVGGSRRQDAYMQPGDPLGYRHICSFGAAGIWGFELKRLETCRVTVQGTKL